MNFSISTFNIRDSHVAGEASTRYKICSIIFVILKLYFSVYWGIKDSESVRGSALQNMGLNIEHR